MMIIANCLLLIGVFYIISGSVGCILMKKTCNKLHAISLSDTVGTLFTILGTILYVGFCLVSVKLILAMVIILISGVTMSHTMANMIEKN